ncbi:MAG: hypothetical protein MJZ59_02290 [Paludibacteraceae bacterium]|nr:hypothetical protein [Paludibacteraceae bacterium]
MIAKSVYPIAQIRGCLSDNYYSRVMNGKIILQRKPACKSDKQRTMRKAFGAKYAGKRTEGACP